jgi:gluconolactonase
MRTTTLSLLFATVLLLARAQDMPLSDVLIEGKGWEMVAEGFGFTDGACADAEGNFYFADVAKGTSIQRISPSGEISIFVDGVPGISGMEFGPEGRIYACQIREGRVLVFAPDGKMTVLGENVKPNDLVVTRGGGVYFTETPAQQITFISPEGKMRSVSTGQVAKPNGITLSADQGTLAVSEHGGTHVWAFRIDADGGLSAGAPYMKMRSPPGSEIAQGDGMTTDAAGRFYATSALGLQMFDPTGRICGIILKPQEKPMVSVCFAGEGLRWLYVCCGDKIYRRETRSPGLIFAK